MMSTVVNLTAHAVAVVAPDGSTLASWEPSGTVARLREVVDPGEDLDVGAVTLPTVDVRYLDDVNGLPDQREGVLLIVSRVLAAVVARSDVVFPAEEVRDERGRIIGCRALGRFAEVPHA